LLGDLARNQLPALVLAYPFRDEGQAIYQQNSDYTLVWIGTNDMAFFCGVAVFWYWLARMMERSESRRSGTVWRRNAMVGSLGCGALIGGLAGAYSTQMLNSHWHPEMQIGAFGALWAFALIGYFTWRLAQGCNTGRNGLRSARSKL
jgi:hypothetical protein